MTVFLVELFKVEMLKRMESTEEKKMKHVLKHHHYVL